MIGPAEFLLAGLLPLVVAFVTRFLVSKALGPNYAWIWAATLGFVAAYLGLAARGGGSSEAIGALAAWWSGLPSAMRELFNPTVAKAWLPLAAVVAAVVASLSQGRARWWVLGLLGLPLAIALPTRLLLGSIYFLSDWSKGESILIVTLLGIALTLIAGTWLASTHRSEPKEESSESQEADRQFAETVATQWAQVLLGGFTVFGIAIGLMLSGTQAYGELAGSMAAALLGALLAGSMLTRPSRWAEGFTSTGPVVAAVVGGLLMLGVFYAELTRTNAILLAAALLMAGGWVPNWVSSRPMFGSITRASLSLAPMAIALTLAGMAFAEAMQQQAADPYLNWQP